MIQYMIFISLFQNLKNIMPDINNVIVYSTNSKVSIEKIKKLPNFNHKSWEHDDLKNFRSEVRQFYRTEQKGQCAFCKKPISLVSAANCQVEHIVPKSIHIQFIFTEKNLCVICADCNQIKRDQETLGEIPNTIKSSTIKQYPRSSDAFLIVHPHFDNYDDHIKILHDKYYVDKTKKGHFTIGTCNLNRELHKFGVDESILEDDEMSELESEFMSCTDHKRRIQILSRMTYLESLKE